MSGFSGWAGGHHTKDESKRQLALMATQFSSPEKTKCLILNQQALVASPSIQIHQRERTAIVLMGNLFLSTKGSHKRLALTPEEALDIYLNQGAQCLHTFKGQFGLCIVSEEHQEVLLVSDRAGTYPLYFSDAENHFIFGTHCSSLLRHMALSTEIDPQSLYQYFYFHAIPSPYTLYKNIQRVEPGHYILYRHQKWLSIPYWKPASFPKKPASFQAAKQELFEVLEASIQPYENKPYGAFLSGGLDSSTVLGMMTKVFQRPIDAFTMGFDQDRYDESSYAVQAAKHFGARHHHFNLQADDLYLALPTIIQQLDQPFGNASLIGAYFCSKMAHDKGMKGLLAGDGGDELFGGNSRYLKQLKFNHYHQIPKMLRQGLLEYWLSFVSDTPPFSLIRKFKKFVNASKLPVPLRLEIHNLMNHFEIQKIINPDILNKVDLHQPSRLLSMSYKEAQGESWLNKLLCMDLKWVLADNDLIKVRSACQMNDLNVGFPLLDERLIKFALKLPDHYKLRNQHLRPFFKRAMQDFLPKTILQKQKHGFSVPVGQWILNNASLRAYTMDTLSEFKKREFLSASFIDDLKDRLLMEHPGYYGVMVWLIVVLELWLQTKQYAISHLDANHYWMEQTA